MIDKKPCSCGNCYWNDMGSYRLDFAPEEILMYGNIRCVFYQLLYYNGNRDTVFGFWKNHPETCVCPFWKDQELIP